VRRAELALAATVSMLLTPSLQAAPLHGAAAAPSAAEAAVLGALNDARLETGIPAVSLAPELAAGARAYAEALVEEDLFVHAGLVGMGELLAWGTGSLGDAGAVVDLWLESPAHRAILLSSRFRHAGIGVAVGAFQGRRGVRLTVVRLAP
jgi:uncharacterized protein YkwD